MSDLNEQLRAALDAEYPAPTNNPHASVVDRARAARRAFTEGWHAARRATLAAAPVAAPASADDAIKVTDEGLQAADASVKKAINGIAGPGFYLRLADLEIGGIIRAALDLAKGSET